MKIHILFSLVIFFSINVRDYSIQLPSELMLQRKLVLGGMGRLSCIARNLNNKTLTKSELTKELQNILFNSKCIYTNIENTDSPLKFIDLNNYLIKIILEDNQ